MKQSKEFLLQKDITTEILGNGVSRQILGYNEDIMLVKVNFEKGSIGDIHNHKHVQSSYIESGEFEVTIGDEMRKLKQGDGFFVPSNVSHGVVCTEKGVIIDTFSPMRKDFTKTDKNG
ncbi:cupin domain-containing protein [Prevotella sp. 10(H)]|uniref:cupin domain-containing protein n=1 Tax=Prevotella sp. 10(H) TaxID=1158294 RepID=UPI0004A73F74|nr:cupin domain-containing protein [Prevotella sp. 10(H)]